MLCKCSGKYIDIYFILKITYFLECFRADAAGSSLSHSSVAMSESADCSCHSKRTWLSHLCGKSFWVSSGYLLLRIFSQHFFIPGIKNSVSKYNLKFLH